MILNLGCGDDSYGDIRADLTRSSTINLICDAHFLPFRSNIFSIAYSKNLFEHLQNPMLSLKEQKRVLKTGGKVVLITDNAAYWRFYLPSNVHRKHRGRSEHDLHYMFFLPMHLENFFQQAGLEQINVAFLGEERFYRITGAINYILRRIPLFQHFSYGRIKAVGVKMNG